MQAFIFKIGTLVSAHEIRKGRVDMRKALSTVFTIAMMTAFAPLTKADLSGLWMVTVTGNSGGCGQPDATLCYVLLSVDSSNSLSGNSNMAGPNASFGKGKFSAPDKAGNVSGFSFTHSTADGGYVTFIGTIAGDGNGNSYTDKSTTGIGASSGLALTKYNNHNQKTSTTLFDFSLRQMVRPWDSTKSPGYFKGNWALTLSVNGAPTCTGCNVLLAVEPASRQFHGYVGVSAVFAQSNGAAGGWKPETGCFVAFGLVLNADGTPGGYNYWNACATTMASNYLSGVGSGTLGRFGSVRPVFAVPFTFTMKAQ